MIFFFFVKAAFQVILISFCSKHGTFLCDGKVPAQVVFIFSSFYLFIYLLLFFFLNFSTTQLHELCVLDRQLLPLDLRNYEKKKRLLLKLLAVDMPLIKSSSQVEAKITSKNYQNY